jgi:predicted ester cyclase
MTPEEMRRAFDVHREAEIRRDLPAVVETFDDNCFLENVAVGTRAAGKDAVLAAYTALFTTFPDIDPDNRVFAYGDDVMVNSGTVRGTMNGDWLGILATGRGFECAFTNVVPFKNGKMQGEAILFDLASMCEQIGISIDDLRARARRSHA